MRRSLGSVGFLLFSCGLQIDLTEGKRCDSLHPCQKERFCIEGRCFNSSPIFEGPDVLGTNDDAGADSSLNERDAGYDGSVDLDASVGPSGDAGGFDAGRSEDAGSMADAGAKDAGSISDAGFDAGLPLGRPCSGNNLCASGICSQSVCCNEPCDGACQSCTSGSCRVRPAASPGVPACFSLIGCNGVQGTCPAQCSAGTCTLGLRCDQGSCVKKAAMLVSNFSSGWAPLFEPFTYGSGGTPNASNGAISLTNVANLSGGVGILSKALYDLEESSVTVQLVSIGAQSLTRQAYLSLESPDSNSGSLYLMVRNGFVVAQSHLNSTTVYPPFGNPMPLAGNGPVSLRIRSAHGMVYFEILMGGSPVTVASGANPLGVPLLNMRVQFVNGCYADNDCVSATSVFDNVNAP
jgi:hypothetical protein